MPARRGFDHSIYRRSLAARIFPYQSGSSPTSHSHGVYIGDDHGRGHGKQKVSREISQPWRSAARSSASNDKNSAAEHEDHCQAQ